MLDMRSDNDSCFTVSVNITVNPSRGIHSIGAWMQTASWKNGNKNHAYFDENRGRRINLVKHIFSLYGLLLSFS